MRPCTVCIHPKSKAVEAALLNSQPLAKIADQFGLSKTALGRHKKHIVKTLALDPEVLEYLHSGSLLDRLKAINRHTSAVLAEARAAGNGQLALVAISRLEKQIELEARLIGELKEHGTGGIGNITVNVTYVEKDVLPTARHPLTIEASKN